MRKAHLNTLLKFILVFLIGFLISSLINFYLVYGKEMPLLKTIGFSNDYSKEVPYDYIKESNIKIFPDRIVIYVNNASLGRYAPTGSMIPILDETSHGIRIVPKQESDIHIGDIISYQDKNSLIIHRVINIGTDKNGTYFITKGDNNNLPDRKVRFSEIKYITIGILW